MDDDDNEYNSRTNRDRGVVLTLGFLPGLKACAIPLTAASVRIHGLQTMIFFSTNIELGHFVV